MSCPISVFPSEIQGEFSSLRNIHLMLLSFFPALARNSFDSGAFALTGAQSKQCQAERVCVFVFDRRIIAG